MRKRLRESYEDFVIENDVLIKYNGTSRDVVIPDNVKIIGERAFMQNEYIEYIDTNNTAEIKERAFVNCMYLKSARLPKVKVIGEYAFAVNHNLNRVSMPEVERIDEGAFNECTSLFDVYINDMVDIHISAFDNTPITDGVIRSFGLDEAVEDKEETKGTETPDVEKILRSMVKKYDGILQYGASFGDDEKQFMVAFDDETGKWIALDDNNEMIGDTEADNLEDFIKELLDREQ